MKIVTYNIHRGRSVTGRPILGEVALALDSLGADVIACQEVVGVDIDGHADQAAWLADRLGMQARFVVNAATRHGPLGNATLSRLPIEAHANLDLSIRGFENRGALRTVLAPSMDVWNVHLGLTARQRAEQWRRLCAALHEAPRALVVCGDFNDWSGLLRGLIERFGLVNALHRARRHGRATFPARRPWFRLDRLYYRSLELVDAEVLRGAPWTGLSDHLPVVATFAEPAR